jgi:hypothetical protein
MHRSIIAGLIAGLISSCTAKVDEPFLSVSPERQNFLGASERVVFRVRAVDAEGRPGAGPVTLTAPVGRFLNEVTLVDGFATATFSCEPSEQAACQGPVRVGAEWAGVRATSQVTVVTGAPIVPVQWDVVSTGSTAALFAIDTAPDGTAWAVGEHGTVLHLAARGWLSVPTGVRGTLRAVAFTAGGQPLVGGDDGVVLALEGDRFQALVAPLEGDVVTALAVDSRGVVHVGMRSGRLLWLAEAGAKEKLTAPGPIAALAVYGDEVWAVGERFMARWVGSSWALQPSPDGVILSSVSATDDALLLSGTLEGISQQYGVVVAGPSPTWKSSALPAPVRVAAGNGDERFALTSTGLYRQVGNAEWSKVEALLDAKAMTSRQPGDLVLVGPPGTSLLRAR